MNPEPCTCHPLHKACDPQFCDKADPGKKDSSSGASAFKTPLKIIFSRAKLANAAAAGCITCEALQAGIIEELRSMDWEEDIIVQRDHSHLDARLLHSTFEYFQGTRSGPGCNAFPFGNARSLLTASEITFSNCQTWIDECVKTHPHCGIVEVPFLPTRVIDIGYLGQNKFSPRLYETNSVRGSYAALSHCWGSCQIITTTDATLNSRKQGIAWNLLSKTFQDALTITQKLGIRYIWIDSLCIIQDNVLDWENESTKMGGIFEESMVTIAAVKAPDGRGGCFARGYGARMFVPSNKRSAPSEIYFRECPRHEGFAIQTSLSRKPSDCPLFRRAWTLQEELLARRVLYYTKNEVVWQCKSHIACQCGRISDPLNLGDSNSFKLDYEVSLRKASGVGLISYQWSRVIMQYTARKITKDTDRLPALSGIAKVFQSRGLGDYVAGHWAKSLPLCLTWSIDGQHREEQRGPYVAPSWSWASINASIPVSFPLERNVLEGVKGKLHAKTQVIDIHCELASSDPTGAIHSAYLAVTGLAVDAKVESLAAHNSQPVGGNLILRRGEFVIPFVGDYKPTTMIKLGDTAVQCLLICTWRDRAYLMVLARVPSTRKYRRLGVVNTNAVKVLKSGHMFSGREQTCLIVETFFKGAEYQEFVII